MSRPPFEFDLIRFSKHPEGAPVVTQNGSCPTSHSHQIGEKVRQCVSDLSSLLGLILSMRAGLDDLPPRDCAQIAQVLETSLPQSVRDELARTYHNGSAEFVIDTALIQKLEIDALRKLSGR